MRCLSFGICALVGFSAFSPAEESEKAAAKPSVKKIGETRYRIGLVEFDAKTKAVEIPVVVNQREGGPIEYILVSEKGKVHEAILTTQASPMDIQVALKLLKYEPGKGKLFEKLTLGQDRKVAGEVDNKPGTLVDITIQWQTETGEKKTSSINEWALDGATLDQTGISEGGEPMAEHPWTFTGSQIYGGQFLAEIEGSIIAIYLDPGAVFNTDAPGAEIDERWGANAAVIPEIGTKATLVINRRG